MIAVILAAGAGRRLWPYAETQPKAALPVANRPLIQWQLEALAAAGVDALRVVVGHLEGQVRAALVDAGEVRFIHQTSPPGTATALLDGLAGDDTDVLVLYGDILPRAEHLTDLLAVAEGLPAAALICRHDGRPGDWLGATARDGRLTGLLGHSRDGDHRFAGAFVLRRAALPYLRANPGCGVRVPVGGMPHLEADLEESLGLMLDRDLPVGAAEVDPLVDLDKPWHLLQANRVAADWLFDGGESRLDGCEIHPDADVEAQVVAAPGSYIGPRCRVRGRLYLSAGARLDNGVICDGTVVIGRNVRAANYCQLEQAVIGHGCRLDHAAEVDGVLMDGCYLVHYMHWSGILGRHSDLGAATVCGSLRFDDGDTTHHVAGRREQPAYGANAVYVGDFCRTGVGAVLMPGVKVGPYSVVGAGVVLNEDLPARTRRLVRQEYDDRPWGPERYGW